MTDLTTIDVCCPKCAYSPVKYVKERNDRAVAFMAQDWTDPPETREDVLDFFEVGGADEGCIFCPACSCEFDAETGEIAASRLRQEILPKG